MKNLFLAVVLAALTGCAGGGPSIQSIALPDIQEISYKDIVSCKKVPAPVVGFSDCRVKHKSGLAVTMRFQTSQIPEAPVLVPVSPTSGSIIK